MNIKQIQELIKFVAKSGATEVDLEMGDVKICIKSPPKGKINTESLGGNVFLPPVAQPPVAQPPVAQPPVAQPPVAQPPVTEPITNDSVSRSNESNEYITVKSPIIGTFYRKPAPDKDTFVNVGDKINVGSVVGIVEAMKLFNEIESEISGTIVKVLVDDMSPVEYDQPLFLVDPN
ncbi:MAG: acetyl-CoA carboxylase, biotin carboxyl carrier protein [Flavobacteriales bacterium]|nr:acetyl-CoA carboxylase, biotin carboxyl carrier protein [Flavobacteriales bacterium]